MARRRAAGNLLDRDVRIAEERQPGGLVLLVEHRRSSAGAATGAGGGEPGAGPLLNDGPLELSERAEDVKDELAAGRGPGHWLRLVRIRQAWRRFQKLAFMMTF